VTTRQQWGGPVTAIGSLYTPAMTAVTAHNTYRPALPASAPEFEERIATLSIHRHHAQKWAGVGYHFLIYQSGRIHEGRGWRRVGAHAGTNEGNRTLGVAFVIDGEQTTPSAEALRSFADLRAEGERLGHLTRGHALRFHSDWKATVCPGQRVVDALMRPLPNVRIVLRRGDRGDDVRALQELLVRLGYMTQAQMNTGPGTFGPATDAAFRDFRLAHGS
jgi:hypothetical protein